MKTDYSTVTEVPGNKVTHEQMLRMYHRYRFACDYCEGKDVLEVACGAGLGLGLLAKRAKRVLGGDYTEKLLEEGARYYRGRIPLMCLDAHYLPFRSESFDVIILYEAIYYLNKPEMFISEVKRILRKNGILMIATVNKDWEEFNPSPYSTHYFSVPELEELFKKHDFRSEFYAAFPVSSKGMKAKVISEIRKIAVSLHLIPKTMRGKELLKKIFYGQLIPLKEEIEEGVFAYEPPTLISSKMPNFEYKIIYGIAWKEG